MYVYSFILLLREEKRWNESVSYIIRIRIFSSCNVSIKAGFVCLFVFVFFLSKKKSTKASQFSSSAIFDERH